MKSWNGRTGVKAGEAKKVLGLKKGGTREEGCWTSEEGSFTKELGCTAVLGACNRCRASTEAGICHRKVCFSSTERVKLEYVTHLMEICSRVSEWRNGRSQAAVPV